MNEHKRQHNKINEHKTHKKMHKHRRKITLYRYRYLIAIILLGGLIAYPLVNKSPKINTVVSAKTQDEETQNTQEEAKEQDETTETSDAADTHNDTDIIPEKNLTYEGEKYSIPASEVQKIVNGHRIDDNKYVFLTFDDGPSPNTEKVLDILKEKGVHATFFILGENLAKGDTIKELLKRSISEGNAIGNHTYTHDFKKLYPNNSVNTDIYMNEYNQTSELMKSVLGDQFNTKVIRMPGGRNSRAYYHDPNLKSFDETLTSDGIVSIDWNVENGDAEGKNYSVDQLYNNAVKESQGMNQIVILMHDTYGKGKTVEMLPRLIDYYKNNGYEFKTIESN